MTIFLLQKTTTTKEKERTKYTQIDKPSTITNPVVLPEQELGNLRLAKKKKKQIEVEPEEISEDEEVSEDGEVSESEEFSESEGVSEEDQDSEYEVKSDEDENVGDVEDENSQNIEEEEIANLSSQEKSWDNRRKRGSRNVEVTVLRFSDVHKYNLSQCTYPYKVMRSSRLYPVIF